MTREAVAWSLVAILAAASGGLVGVVINRSLDSLIDIDGRLKTMEIIHAQEIAEHRRYIDSLDHPGYRR